MRHLLIESFLGLKMRSSTSFFAVPCDYIAVLTQKNINCVLTLKNKDYFSDFPSISIIVDIAMF